MVGYGPHIRIVNDHTVFGYTGEPRRDRAADIYPNLDQNQRHNCPQHADAGRVG